MKFNVKNLFMGVVLIIVLAVVFLRGDQLVELGETMKQGSPLPLVAAILTQLGKYFAQSFAYSRSFAAVGERMEPKSTLPLVFGTFFMNTIAPSMNLAGTTLVVDDARRRGIPAGKATGAALLMQITIDGAFSTIMVCAFIFLAVTVGLSPVWFLMGMVVLCLVGTMVALLILAHKKPDLLMRLLRPVERVSRKVVARVRKKPLEPWAERIAQAFSEAAGMIGHSPKPTLQAYGCSLIASLCELSCFALVGIGFGVDTAPALVCGYVVATLFAMISVTPQGVGVVEAAVVVAFTSFGESAAAGTAIGLVYRGIVFWMPFIIGAVLINTTKVFKGDVKQAAYDQDMGAVAGTAATAARLRKRLAPTRRGSSVRPRCAHAWRMRMRRMVGSRLRVRCRRKLTPSQRAALRWRTPLPRRCLLRRAIRLRWSPARFPLWRVKRPCLQPIRRLLRRGLRLHLLLKRYLSLKAVHLWKRSEPSLLRIADTQEQPNVLLSRRLLGRRRMRRTRLMICPAKRVVRNRILIHKPS